MSDIRKRTGANGTTYQVRYASNATKAGYAYKTFKTLKSARDFVESGATNNAGNCTAEITTVADAVQRWLDICEKIGRDGREKVEPVTLEDYRRRGTLISEYPWSKPIQELEPADVVHFRDWLLQRKSRNTARRTLSSFHSVMIEMKHQGQIKDDPAAGISIKSSGRYQDHQNEVQIPSDNEIRAILSEADNMGQRNDQMQRVWRRYRPMVYLAVFSGMRPSEIRGLAWSSISDGLIDVRQRADRHGNLGPVKSRAGRRKIYIPDFVSGILMDWRPYCPKSDDDLVFPTSTGRAQLLGMIRRGAWVPLLRSAGLTYEATEGGQVREKTKYKMYALRHYFASKLIETGVDLKFIQESMGHSSIEITFNVYGHLLKGREEERRSVAEGLAQNILG